MDLQFQFKVFRHRLQYQIGLFDAAVVRVGDQPVQYVARLAAGQVLGLAEFGRVADGLGNGAGLGVMQADAQTLQRGPAGNIAPHRTRADHMQMLDRIAGQAF